VGKALRDKQIAPFTIGTKFLWTAAGWFDYLNLRINGLKFHLQLTGGLIPWTDPRVKAVFDHWKQLLDAKFFISDHPSYSWQEAMPFLVQKKAAMYLMGAQIIPFFKAEGIADKIGFIPFPRINSTLADFEDAPTDTLHIPTKATNKEDAMKFLAFMARADVQSQYNQTVQQLPVNKQATVSSDPFLQEGKKLLHNAAGLAQFFDRDTNPQMAKVAMQGFQQFMVEPDQLDNILNRLEQTRQRVYQQGQ